MSIVFSVSWLNVRVIFLVIWLTFSNTTLKHSVRTQRSNQDNWPGFSFFNGDVCCWCVSVRSFVLLSFRSLREALVFVLLLRWCLFCSNARVFFCHAFVLLVHSIYLPNMPTHTHNRVRKHFTRNVVQNNFKWIFGCTRLNCAMDGGLNTV